MLLCLYMDRREQERLIQLWVIREISLLILNRFIYQGKVLKPSIIKLIPKLVKKMLMETIKKVYMTHMRIPES